MTVLEGIDDEVSLEGSAAVLVEEPEPQLPLPPPAAAPSGGRRGVGWLVALWAVVVVVGIATVWYVVEPLFQEREQSQLLDAYRAEIDRAANQGSGLAGVEEPTRAPALGAPVGILEVGPLRLQQVVVEGVGSSQTTLGPGHVPGTAAPGQPGNAVVVGRRSAFGGPFGDLSSLAEGDQIVVTTTQGQSLYVVDAVRHVGIVDADGGETAAPASAPSTLPLAGEEAIDPEVADAATDPAADEPSVATVDELYGPTDDDRLTLVTSDSALPWNSSDAVVVTAELQGEPFPPTLQNGRTDDQEGFGGDWSAWPSVLLALGALGAVVAGSVVAYRRFSLRAAYLLTVAPLMVGTVLAAEALALLLPAWT